MTGDDAIAHLTKKPEAKKPAAKKGGGWSTVFWLAGATLTVAGVAAMLKAKWTRDAEANREKDRRDDDE